MVATIPGDRATPILSVSQEIDTPALVVDEAILKRNIDEMAAFANSLGVKLRPHIKTHKSTAIARQQIAAGAVGTMCAKLGEAEIMADGGLDDIAIGNQIIGPSKMERLLALSARAKLTVAVDSIEGARQLSQTFSQAGQSIDVYLEIDTGHHRAGVLPEFALDLATGVAEMPGVNLTGVMTHEGSANMLPRETIEAEALRAGQLLVETADSIKHTGIPISIVSVGSTPAAAYTPTVDGVTEMRPGTYVFRDVSAFRYGVYGPDRCAARIVSTVTSRAAPDRAVIDAGSKTLSLDRNPSHPGHGYIVGHPRVVITGVSEEHGHVTLPPHEPGFEIGDRVEIIPNHICQCVNLRDWMLLVRDGVVIGELPVSARGQVT